MQTNRRHFLKLTTATAVAAGLGSHPLGAATDLEKFYRNDPFRASDFQWISDWGFDFVRLPMDYRQWTDSDDPYRWKEPVLEHIDQAIEFGRQYGIHVSLNLHNAPGYSVNRAAKHSMNLWTDAEAQKQFAFQWSAFARRYRNVPSSRLSFNLVNEPANIDEPTYARAVRGAIDGIRAADPTRLIITDGLNWGREPVRTLAAEGIVQSTRGYEPFGLTHYRASWVSGADRFPVPQWPVPQINGHLYGPGHRNLHTSLVIAGPFEAPMSLRVRVGQVSARGRLLVQADDQTILEHTFRPGSGTGEVLDSIVANLPLPPSADSAVATQRHRSHRNGLRPRTCHDRDRHHLGPTPTRTSQIPSKPRRSAFRRALHAGPRLALPGPRPPLERDRRFRCGRPRR